MWSEKNRMKLGWVLFGFFWLALVANIANDWFRQGWISPLSILMVVTVSGMMLYQWVRGRPLLTTEGWRMRLGIIVVLLVVGAAILLWTMMACCAEPPIPVTF